MADRPFKLEVITPDRVVLSDKEITSVVLPGALGYLGVLANHAPLMTELSVGELDFRRIDGSRDFMAVSGGFLEVFDNVVTALAESAEPAGEININRAEQAAERARGRIEAHDPSLDVDRAAVALKKALNRLSVARHHG
ncbi:MAG: ATP synthase F1 subunit epsilon [Armatimonadetes bacterium RBG_16_58_9]|nr:MAG: ATP synthase F1 subunit epsilon [Armatimonadetes bacterium RBG_16_58_9]